MGGAGRWLVALVVGFVTLRFVFVTGRSLLAAPALRRENFRGRPVPTAAGILVPVTVLFVEAGRSVLGALGLGDDPGLDVARASMLLAVVGFALLGLLDDVLGDGSARGFRGHVGEALRGRLTTGFVKLAGGGALAVVLVASPGFASGRRLVIDAVLIALAANLGNLLDRAPGRVGKAGMLAYVPLALALGASDAGVALAVVMGAFAALLGDDLRERVMLGDTGANVLGAALGLGVVLGCGAGVRLGVMLALLALNAAAEAVSFSAVIERVPPLRRLDGLGRRP